MVVDPNTFFTVKGIIGEEALVICPYHDDHKPSASFNVRTGLFHCFTCSTGKNIDQLCKDFGIDRSEVPEIEHVDFSKEEIKDWNSYMTYPLALENWYMREREVPNWIIKRLQIRACDEGIIFPQIQPNGELTGVQLRKYEGQPKYEFIGLRAPIWPSISQLPRSMLTKRIYLVEGVFGAIRALSAGLTAFATLSSSGISKAGPLLQGRDVVVVFDDDFAGWLGAAKSLAFGFKVAFPTFEADTEPIDGWQLFSRVGEKALTTNLNVIAEESGAPIKIKRSIYRFIKKAYNK